MPFSSVPWATVDIPSTSKRALSDSGIEFDIPASKRSKASLSDGDKEETDKALSPLSKQQL